MMEQVAARLAELAVIPGTRVLVAVSGGGDSVALLDLLVRGASLHRLELIVAHADHGISPESGRVAERVERLAGEYRLRCLTGHLQLGSPVSETRARDARYRWLEETRRREGAEWIITAHHAEDQAETVLLRVLHGSGPAGLAAMAGQRDRIVRPLLAVTRREIAAYLAERGLPWWDDPANHDPRHLRSWVRTVMLPLVRERLPGVDQALRQVAEQAADDRTAWDQALQWLPGLDWRAESSGGSVAAAPLAGYDSTLAAAVLRAAARRVGCQISRDHLRRVQDLLRRGASGSQVEVGNGWSLEIVFDRLHFRPPDRPKELGSSPAGRLVLEGDAGDGVLGRWRFFWRYEAAPAAQPRDGLTAWFTPEPLEARGWREGDKVYPLGGRGRRLVVRCLQDARVPRWDRPEWPMVTDSAGEIVWVPGVCRSNRVVPLAGTEALRVDAQVV